MLIMEGNDSILQVASCLGKLIGYISGFKKNISSFEKVKTAYQIKN